MDMTFKLVTMFFSILRHGIGFTRYCAGKYRRMRKGGNYYGSSCGSPHKRVV